MEVARRPLSTDVRSGGRTNAYVLGSDPAVLVDPARRDADLDRLVRERGVEHVLATHAHPDHVGGVAAYADLTDAAVWARRGYVDRFREATGSEPDRLLRAGTRIPLGAESVTALDAPGHAPDHVALVAGDGGPIVCGDCAVREGSVAVAAPDGDVRAYMSTLRRLWAIDPPTLLPGHGPTIDEPRRVLERLLAHRRERERRVLAAVRDGAETLDAVLEAAYRRDLAGVRDLARATTVAHLEKLAVEGRIAWDGRRASLF